MIWLIGYIATIFAANWALETFGVLTFTGLAIPAGTLFAGLAFTFRDLLHEAGGRWWVLAGIGLGAACSALVSPQFAVASAVAFGLSETLDWFVYSPLRLRHWLGAVAASNVVGFVADSLLFLWLAFGSLAFLPGQLAGKGAMTALAVLVLWLARRRWAVAYA